MQWGLHVLHLLSEGVTLRVLYRLFFKPRPYATPEREMPYRTAWDWHLEETPWGTLSVGRTHPPTLQKGSVLLLHGWSGRPTQLGALVGVLTRSGYACTVLTAPGHEEGNYRYSSLKDFAEYAAWINQNQGPFDAAVGHSLGGAALLMAAEHGAHWSKIVAISAFGRTERVFQEFIRQSGLPDHYVGRLFQRVKDEFGTDPRQYSPDRSSYGGALHLIHAPDDVEVPFEDAELLHVAFPQSTLLPIPNGGHRKILWMPETGKAVLGYLES